MSKDTFLQVVALLWFLALAVVVPARPRMPLAVQPKDTRAVPSETTLFAPVPVGLAESVLAKAERLYAVQVGYAGITPPEALAWRIIARDPDGRRIFEGLLGVPSRPARVYALIGLKWLRAPSYSAAAAALRQQGGSIDITIGCIGSSEPLDRLLDQIDGGRWGAEFMLGHLITPE